MAETTLFHAHLDECERCRNQPFNLCSWGFALLQQAAMAPALLRSPTREGPTV